MNDLSFISAPECVAIRVQKEFLFREREKEIAWTKNELETGEEDTILFLRFGRNVLEQINFGIHLEQINF